HDPAVLGPRARRLANQPPRCRNRTPAPGFPPEITGDSLTHRRNDTSRLLFLFPYSSTHLRQRRAKPKAAARGSRATLGGPERRGRGAETSRPDVRVTPLLIAAMLQLFILAMVQNESIRRAAPTQWLYLGVAVIGMAFAATLLV